MKQLQKRVIHLEMPTPNKRNCCTTINTTQLSTKEKKHKNTNINIQALIYPFFDRTTNNNKNRSCATGTNGCAVSRGVCSRKVLREFESLSPAQKLHLLKDQNLIMVLL